MAEPDKVRGPFKKKRHFLNRSEIFWPREDKRHGRFFDKRDSKYYKEDKDKEIKQPVILMKPKSDAEKNKQETTVQPTILMKPKPTECNTTLQPSVSKVPPETSKPSYQIASKARKLPSLKKLLLGNVVMKESVKLITSEGHFKDSLLKYLTDEVKFCVIGCIGPPCSGKTTLLSHLAVQHVSNRIFNGGAIGDKTVHKITEGIDVYINDRRCLFLDSQSIDPCAIDKWSSYDFDDPPQVESETELRSYQHAAFLMAVCHVVIFVQEEGCKVEHTKFLQMVEVFKPITTVKLRDSNEVVEYYPQVLMVHNKCTPTSFTQKNICNIQEFYWKEFGNSKLQVETGLSITYGWIMPSLQHGNKTVLNMNTFLLPVYETKAELKSLNEFRGHLGYNDLVNKLRLTLAKVGRTPLSLTTLTEKKWFQYACKVWDNMNKNTNYGDYSRVVPWALSQE